MSKGKTKFILFSIGGIGYGLIEILWRGYTHPSMITAGGLCFLSFGNIYGKIKRFNLLIRGIIGGAIITFIEFIFGIIFNVILKKNVWDYSRMPLNIGGQICAVYSFFWVILSMIFMPFAGFITKKLYGGKGL